jgi:hypothetical protein
MRDESPQPDAPVEDPVAAPAAAATPAPEPVAAPAADATLPDPVEELDDDEEFEDDADDDAPPAPLRVSLTYVIGVAALSLTLGAAFAAGVLAVIASSEAPPPAVSASLAAPPRPAPVARPAVVALDAAAPSDASEAADDDASSDASSDASTDGALVQETEPEDVGDGVMDDLGDGPPPPRSRARTGHATASAPRVNAGSGPTRGVTSDNVPEGPAQGYVDGRAVRIQVTRLDGKPVERHTAAAYRRMYEAAERAGVHLHIVSGFRTMEHQQALYRAYQRGQGNLAAVPGHSNHQSGHALDLNTRAPGVLRWLERNGRRYGFRRTVPTEAWHWEWW